MSTKVSVIVPVYNCSQYIGKCVESLMNQTLDQIEYIFIDDNSKDDSYSSLLKSLAKYPERSKNAIIKRHEDNRGVSRTRNEGIDLASGEFIAFCDSDDWMDERMYERLYQKATDEHAEMVFCDFYLAYHDRNILHQNHIETCMKNKTDLLRSYIREEWNPLWDVLVSKDIYDRSGYRFPTELSFTEDFNLMVRLVHESKKTCCINEGLYYYNQTNINSIMHRPGSKRLLDEIKSYEQIQQWMESKGIYRQFKREMGWRFLKAKANYVEFGHFDDFRQIHTSSNRYILSLPSNYCHYKLKLLMLSTILHLDFIPRWRNHKAGRY